MVHGENANETAAPVDPAKEAPKEETKVPDAAAGKLPGLSTRNSTNVDSRHRGEEGREEGRDSCCPRCHRLNTTSIGIE